MQFSYSTPFTHCRYSNHHSLHAVQSPYSYFPLPLFNHQPPSCSPFTLLTLPTLAFQTTNTFPAVQSLYSYFPLPLFKTPTPIIQSSLSTHISHCCYSNHQPPSYNPVTLLTLPIVGIETTKSHHAV
jgi:hypothetical protein